MGNWKCARDLQDAELSLGTAARTSRDYCTRGPLARGPVDPILVYHGVIMALNLKNLEVERLAGEVARLAGESKTEAIRRALEERRQRLMAPATAQRRARVLRFLKTRVWPTVPKQQLGRRLTGTEEDALLGYGPDGV